MHPKFELMQTATRRHFLKDSALGLGAVALASLAGDSAPAAPAKPVNPLAPKQPHFEGKAKRVIYLHMTGFRWCTKPLKLKRIFIELYVHHSRKTNRVWYDDIALSTGYIGPIEK